MSNIKKVEWILRVAVAGEFLGHGMFALQGKEGWFKYFEAFGITDPVMMINILMVVGTVDVFMAGLVLLKPIRLAVLWMAFWGLFTALIRWPLGPDPVWDFVERFANFGAPLALLYILGIPKSLKEWLK